MYSSLISTKIFKTLKALIIIAMVLGSMPLSTAYADSPKPAPSTKTRTVFRRGLNPAIRLPKPLLVTNSYSFSGTVNIPDNNVAGACVTINVPDLGTITGVNLSNVGVTHTWIGDLRFRLYSPDGTYMTPMDRPGRTTAGNGDSSNLSSGFPLSFSDANLDDAETMGNTIADGQIVCQNDTRCAYLPNRDQDAGSLTTFGGFSNGTRTTQGDWLFCAYDFAGTDVGSINSVTLNLTYTLATTTTITSDNPDPSEAGQPVVVNYSVTTASGTPTGNVTISDGVNNCINTVAAGTCTISLTTVGARTLTATYAGDANYSGSVSAGEDHTVAAGLAPTVTLSVPADGATVSPGPTQLTATFSEDVKSDGSLQAANNVANYLLVEDGANGIFDTIACGGPGGGLALDDAPIAINSASYPGGSPFIATLNINGGTALPAGTYRLFICGTTSIEDLANIELNNGADTLVTFTVPAATGGPSGGGGNTQRANAIPATGFPQGEITSLPIQPAEKAYTTVDIWIEIPKLDVKMPIVGVSQTTEGWDVTWLNRNAGWLNGSAYPTWSGNSVITAHVWDALNKPGPFARLKELIYGDQVKIHAFGQVYTYEIRETTTISPKDTTAMLKHQDKAWVTLITCEGYQELTQDYSSRRMVRAVLVSVTVEK